MKILLVVNNFIPEIGSAAHLYFELGKALQKRNHQVHIITMYPRPYNLPEAVQNEDFQVDEIVNGLHIHRCKLKFVKRDNFILRGLEHFIVPFLFYSRFKQLNIQFDGIILYIPPLPLYWMAKLIKHQYNIKSVLNIQDIHPQELIDVGLVKNPVLKKFLEFLEKDAYKTADYITVLSPKGRKLIIQRGGNPQKISHIYNSIDIMDFDVSLRTKTFKQEEAIENKILVSYAGMLNSFQGIDNILDVAKRFLKDQDIIFYIIGDGKETQRLNSRIINENIYNVILKPLQPHDKYLDIINSTDISIVSLDSRMTAPCLPGKFTNLLGASQCIIANVPLENDIADIVTNQKCGIVVEPGNIVRWTRKIGQVVKVESCP